MGIILALVVVLNKATDENKKQDKKENRESKKA
jgi:hypothetical protein